MSNEHERRVVPQKEIKLRLKKESNECWSEENHIHYDVYTFIFRKYLEILIVLPQFYFTNANLSSLPSPLYCSEESVSYCRIGSRAQVCCSVATATAQSLQSWLTLCDPRDGSPPGSLVPGILQARTLEWIAISFSSGSSILGIEPTSLALAGIFFTTSPLWQSYVFLLWFWMLFY